MSLDWDDLRKWTQARIGLGRAGQSLSTKALLEFQYAHARARDAVHRPWDAEMLLARLDEGVIVHSAADSRAAFLQRPDLGRALRAGEAAKLKDKADLVVCVSDGLSAAAIDAHFIPFWEKLRPELDGARISRHPLVLVPFGRVAISDAIGEAIGAKLAIILIGERPGLTAADSLGIYLTYGPKRGNSDAQRNCLSNIRPPAGLGYEPATRKLMYLVRESLRRQLSGVELKEETALTAGR